MPNYQMTEAQVLQTAQQYENALNQKKASAKRFERILKEVSDTVESLKEIEKVKGKLLVKLGAGVYIEVEAKNIKKCKRGFAENGFVEDTTESTVKWIEEKKEALIKNLEAERKDMIQLESGLTEMISVLRQIESEKRKNFSGK
jgi:prefoldin subunit 5